MRGMSLILKILLIGMCILPACGEKEGLYAGRSDIEASQEKEEKEQHKPDSPDTYTKAKAVKKKNAGIDISKYHNVEEITSYSEFAISSDLQEMSAAAQVIVDAKVKAFSYVTIDGDAWIKMKLTVQRNLKGKLKKGDRITLYRSGGYVPLTEHIRYYHDADRYEDWSDKKIKDTILKESVDGEADPVVGTEAVFYLAKFKKKGILKGNYGRVCGKYAELVKIDSDSYRHELMDEDNSSETVTLAEIREAINTKR